MRRLFFSFLFVLVGVIVGKACQYAAVAHFGARLGFERASLVGLVPFVVTLFVLKRRFPRFFTVAPRRRPVRRA